MNSHRLLALFLACLLFHSGTAWSQVTTGTILGTVTDATGAVIPGATLTLRNVETGISRSAQTDEAGRFRVPQLTLGSYEVTAEAAGFQALVRSGITLTVGREAVLDFALQVGAVAERITVTGEAPLVETTNATVAGLVDERALRDLPLNGRSFADLTGIQPGVVSDLPISAATGVTAVYSGGGSATRRSIGGTKPQQSSYLLDGMEVSTPSEGMPVNSVLGQQLGVDAIREFTVLQSNYGAQYGRAAGGVVNAVTQSGTNEFHGSVFEFFRNDKLDARDYFLLPAQPNAPLKRNQFGASLGGPIQKDSTFFFMNYEGVRQASGDPNLGATYTPLTRRGFITDATGKAPATPRAINKDVAETFFPLLPLPTVLSDGSYGYRSGGVADFYSITPSTASENYGIVRIDRQLSSDDSLFGRLTIDRSNRTDRYPLLLPAGWEGYAIGGYVLAAISETHIFTPTLLNTIRAGYTRRNDHLFYNYSDGGSQFPKAPGLDPRLSSKQGIPLGSWTLPGVSLPGGIGPSNGQGPSIWVDNTFDVDDSLMINRGGHSMSVGANVKRYQMNEVNEPWKYGLFSWQTIEELFDNNPFNATNRIGSYIPGSQVPDVYRGWRQTYGAIYFQDDYRALANLTLNLGVRWEKVSSPKEVNGKLAIIKNLYKDSTYTSLGKEDALFNIRDGLKGLSPRIGFAWTPFSDQATVLRGGFGAFKEVPLVYIYQLGIDAPPYSSRYQVNRPNIRFPYPMYPQNFDPSKAAAGEPLLLPSDFKMPYTMQWNFSLERQLGQTFVAKAIYLGTRSLNQVGVYNPNTQPAEKVNGRLFVSATAKVPNPNFNSFYYTAPIGNQFYHALQLVVEKRLSGGFRFNSSYTYSKNIDQVSGLSKAAENIVGSPFAIYNANDFSAEKGLSAIDVRNNFIFSYTYELPFGSGQRWGSSWSGVMNHLLGGWVINGTNTVRSGLPTSVTMTPRQSRCLQQQCQERPDLINGGNNNPHLDSWEQERKNNDYFDRSQFIVQPLGFYGNVGRNTVTAPGQFNMNFSLSKDNRMGEGKNLEFRAEFFNVLNHPNFGGPSMNLFRNAAGAPSPNAARITSTSTKMRQIQLGLKITF